MKSPVFSRVYRSARIYTVTRHRFQNVPDRLQTYSASTRIRILCVFKSFHSGDRFQRFDVGFIHRSMELGSTAPNAHDGLLLLLLLKRIIIQDKKHFSKRVAVINVCPVMFIKINYNCMLYNINYNIRY